MPQKQNLIVGQLGERAVRTKIDPVVPERDRHAARRELP